MVVRAVAASLALLVVSALAGCGPTNPFDPDTPSTLQAKARIDGSLVVSGCASAGGITVVLVSNGQVAQQVDTLSAGDGGAADGAFSFVDVTPGSYTLEVRREGLPAPTAKAVTVGPSDQVDVGAVVIVPPQSQIAGAVKLADNAAADGVTVVAVGTSSVCGDAAPVSAVGTVSDGGFTIAGLPPGNYEVRALRSGYTPDRELDVGTSDGKSVTLARELLLHPATAVLHVVDDIGAPLRFTKSELVSVEALAFGGFRELRLTTDPTTFDDPDAGYSQFAPLIEGFDLGNVDGEVTVFGQLRDGSFVSDIYSVTVTLDTQAPVVRELSVDGGAVFLAGNEGNVRLIANDALSGVAGFQVSLSALDGTFDLTGTPAGFPGDFVHDTVVSFEDGTGAFADGDYVVHARVVDGAGNISDELTATVRRDTTPPQALSAPGVVVSNAVGGQLFGSRAELAFDIGADVANGVDGAVTLAVDQVGVGRVFDGAYTDHLTIPDVTGSDGQSVTFRATAKDVAGNALVVDAAPVTLNLRGRIFGTVLLDGVPDDSPQHGGTTIEATPVGASSAFTLSTVTAGNGSFAIDELPAGDWVVSAVRTGAVTQTQVVTIAPGVSREVFFARIGLARGALSAVFTKAGLQPGEDNSGILVEAVHAASGFRRQAFTSSDGSVLLENLPERITDELAGEAGYDIVASAAGFAASRTSGVSVLRDETTLLNDAASPIVLARRVGDFEICNTAPANNSCEAVTSTRQTQVFLNLRAENVTQVRISERSAFADANDASDPAFIDFPKADASPFAVTLSDPDGARTVFVQFKDDGGTADPADDTLGAVLQANIILDRAPPHDIGALAVRRDFAGSFDTVLDTDLTPYTNQVQARIRIAVTAAEDDVNESGLASLRVSLNADLSQAQSFAFSPVKDVVLDAGQTLSEGRHDAFVSFCDRAANCTPAAQALRVPIIVDRVAPSILNGLKVKADNTADSVVRDPAGAPDSGVFTTFVRSTSLPVAVGLGTDPALDTDGSAVTEVAAIRLSLEPTFLGRSFIELEGLAAPGQTIVIPDFGLAGAQGTQRIFVQLRDHAGNVTPIGAGNPFFFDVVLDTVPPDALVSLVTGAGQSSFYRRDDPLQVRIDSNGPNAARTMQLSTDGVFDTEPVLAVTSSPQTVAVPVGGLEGTRSLVARLADAAGNVTERNVAFFFDKTPPDATAFAACASCASSGGQLFASDALGQVTLDLFAQDNSGFIDHIDISVDGAVTDAGRTFARFVTTTMSPLPGNHTVAVAFVDAAGNRRSAPTLTITQDSTPPAAGTPPVLLVNAAGTALADGAIIKTRDLSLKAAATAADFMRLSEDSGCASGVDLPFSTLATPFSAGPTEGVLRRVFVRFTDKAGNASPCSAGRSFFLDQTAPNVTFADFVATGGLVNSRTTTVRIDATDASTGFGGALTAQLSRSGQFLADDGDGERTVALAAGGSTNITYSLLAPAVATGAGDGLKSVQLRVIDTAGNFVQRTISVNLDETIPAKPTPLAPAANAFVNTGTPTFTWTAAADATRYRIDIRRASDNVIEQSQTVTVTSFIPVTALGNIDHRWAVHAFDSAGNDSGIDPSFNPPNGILLTVDAAAPTAPTALTVSPGSPTNNNRPTLNFTGATDAQTAQAQLVYTVDISAQSSFANVAVSGTVTGVTTSGSFQPPAPLGDGSWFWRVTARDRAGNATTANAAAPFVIDTVAPVAVELGPVSSPKNAPVVLTWSLPTDADRAGVRLQVATNAQFTSPLLDSLQLDGSENITALLTSGTTVFARVGAEDAVGNRNFVSSVSFAFDSVAPVVAGGAGVAVSLLKADGTAFAADALVLDRNVGIRLTAGTAGEIVTARVSNNVDCSNFTAFALDQPGTSNNVISWQLASGGSFKQAFVRFVDDAGNASACTPSQRVRSSGALRGTATVSAGASGINVGSSEKAGIVVTLTGVTPGLPLTAVTDGDGNYRFAAVPIPDVGTTQYTLSFAKTGFTPSGTVAVTALPDQEVVAGGVTMTIQTGTVSGAVSLRAFAPGGSFCTGTDPQNATSASVTLDGTAFTGEQITRSATPAAGGAFTFANVPPGTYSTSANRDGYLVTAAPANPFALAGGATASGRNFTLDDRLPPSAPLLRSQTPSPSPSSSASIAVDLASADSTAPVQNLRGYDVTRISAPTAGGQATSTSLGVQGIAATLTLPMVDQNINRFVVTPVDCAGNRGTAAEVTVTRDSAAPNTVQNVRADNRDGSVVVTWNANADAEAVTSYRVYYGAFDSATKTDFTGTFAAQGPSPVTVTATATPSATLSGLINDTSFFVAVTAVDAAGNESTQLSTRQIANPNVLPIDLRFEEQLGSTCVSGGVNLKGELAVNDRLAVISTTTSGQGLEVFRLDDRDNITLAGAVPTEVRPRVALFDDFAVVYDDGAAVGTGSSRSYDLHNPAAPTLVVSQDGNAFDQCPGCVIHAVSTEGYAAANNATAYAVAVQSTGGQEFLVPWKRSANRGLFTFTNGSLSMTTNQVVRQVIQAGEMIFAMQTNRVGIYRASPVDGQIEFIKEEILPGTVPNQVKAAFAAPYLFVPNGTGVSVIVVNPGNRTVSAATAGVTTSLFGTFGSRVNGGPQSVVFSGSRLVVFGSSGNQQRILESFDQSGLSTRLPLASRTLPTPLGSLFLKADNFLSTLEPRSIVAVNNQLVALFHRQAAAIGCAFVQDSLELKMFELGSPNAMAEGNRVPRGGTHNGFSIFTIYNDLRGGILTTTETNSSNVFVKAYDLRDPENPSFMSESTGLAGVFGSPFGAGNMSGVAARQGSLVYLFLANPGPSRKIAVLDIAFPDGGIRTVNVGSTMTASGTGENAIDMVVKDGVLIAATEDNINGSTNKNYLATVPVDVPSALPNWVRVAEPTAVSGMASGGLYVDGRFAYTGATDNGGNVGFICVTDLANPVAPVHVRCVPALRANGANVNRVFSVDGVPGFLLFGADAGLELYDIRNGPPSAALLPAHQITPPGGVSQNMLGAGPFIYTTLGNSSQLPLGLLLGVDASRDGAGVPRFGVTGSLNDADPGTPSQTAVAGDVVVVPMSELNFTSFVVQLF